MVTGGGCRRMTVSCVQVMMQVMVVRLLVGGLLLLMLGVMLLMMMGRRGIGVGGGIRVDSHVDA